MIDIRYDNNWMSGFGSRKISREKIFEMGFRMCFMFSKISREKNSIRRAVRVLDVRVLDVLECVGVFLKPRHPYHTFHHSLNGVGGSKLSPPKRIPPRNTESQSSTERQHDDRAKHDQTVSSGHQRLRASI